MLPLAVSLEAKEVGVDGRPMIREDARCDLHLYQNQQQVVNLQVDGHLQEVVCLACPLPVGEADAGHHQAYLFGQAEDDYPQVPV